ncbi:MAG: phage integrase N-terminal SAM-like domain-containing protein [Pseudomonadaceae bacterium]
MCSHHYSIRTEKSYWCWIRYFIRFHQLHHPSELGAAEVNAFLRWLAVGLQVVISAQFRAARPVAGQYSQPARLT